MRCTCAPVAPHELDEAVGDEAGADSVGDGVGERHHGQGQERGEALLEVGEGDLAHDAPHQVADDDQGAGAVAWAGTTPASGARKSARRKHEARDHRGEPGARPADDAGGRLDIGRGRRGARGAARRRGERVHQQHAVEPRQLAVAVSQPASPPMPITVPMVSKKSESMMEKIVTSAVITPDAGEDVEIEARAEAREIGSANSGRGSPPGREGETRGRRWQAFTATASAVVTRMPTRSAPRAAGLQPQREEQAERGPPPPAPRSRSPRVTGTPGGPGFTMPADTRPMKRMKSPMPTPMACFSATGWRS